MHLLIEWVCLILLNLFCILLIVAVEHLNYYLFRVVALHLVVSLYHVVTPVFLVKVNRLVGLSHICWWNTTRLTVLNHFILFKLDSITEHFMGQVLIEIYKDFLNWPRVNREISTRMQPIVVERITDRVLLFKVLIENTQTLILIVLE